MIDLVRDELGAFLFWLAAKLEKKHADAVIRYNAQDWSHLGSGAATTKQQRIFGTISSMEGERTSYKREGGS